MTAHCPNTGSMLGCAVPGSPVWLSRSDNPGRKYAWTWELVEVPEGAMVGIHTGRSNHLVREAIEGGTLPELAGYDTMRGEVPYGEQRSRIDWLLSGSGRPDCYLEVKNVTAAVRDGVAFFPDAVTARGTKHLQEMTALVRQGRRAVLCFCVQRGDAGEVRRPTTSTPPTAGCCGGAGRRRGGDRPRRRRLGPGHRSGRPLPVVIP
ncbi:MAG: DNA/RNA nuclease SfsA [Comamonadaceae bacterium]|nr:DNA/RNA nuclease SfsA [Comamonadaceae bacterium]